MAVYAHVCVCYKAVSVFAALPRLWIITLRVTPFLTLDTNRSSVDRHISHTHTLRIILSPHLTLAPTHP